MLVLKNQFSALEELDGEYDKLDGCSESWKQIQENTSQGKNKNLPKEKMSKKHKQKRVKVSKKDIKISVHTNIILNEVTNSILDKVHDNTDSEIKHHRCQKCFITHYPYFKFCRWAEAKWNKRDIIAPQK